MIVDTSALVALLRNEPETPEIKTALRRANSRRISAATLVESRMVMMPKAGAVGRRHLDSLIMEAQIHVIGVTPVQADLASQAFADFGPAPVVQVPPWWLFTLSSARASCTVSA